DLRAAWLACMREQIDGERLTVPLLQREHHRSDLHKLDAEAAFRRSNDAGHDRPLIWRGIRGLFEIEIDHDPPAVRVHDRETAGVRGVGGNVVSWTHWRPEMLHNAVVQLAAQRFAVAAQHGFGKLLLLG